MTETTEPPELIAAMIAAMRDSPKRVFMLAVDTVDGEERAFSDVAAAVRAHDKAAAQAKLTALGEAYDAAPGVAANSEGAVFGASLIDLIGELGRETWNLLDNSEESGPVGEAIFTVDPDCFTRVSAVLDRIDALPFEEPGYILGTGAMLQAALKQTFVAEITALRAENKAMKAEWAADLVRAGNERRALVAERDVIAARLAGLEEVETRAAADVLSERIRQIEVEGWTPEHDDKHHHGELAGAAAAYCVYRSHVPPEIVMGERLVQMLWRFPPASWKPTTRRRDLVKAGALILAEIERLDRAAHAERVAMDRARGGR